MVRLRYLIYFICFLIFLHFGLYFLDIDIFELFEGSSTASPHMEEDDAGTSQEIDDSIIELEKSIQENPNINFINVKETNNDDN